MRIPALTSRVGTKMVNARSGGSFLELLPHMDNGTRSSPINHLV
jgi:hypothetical protein